MTVDVLLVTELACDPMQHADLGAVVMQEGLANVCLVTSCMTLVRARIETNIPRKRKGQCSQHDKVIIHVHLMYMLMYTENICTVSYSCSLKPLLKFLE